MAAATTVSFGSTVITGPSAPTPVSQAPKYVSEVSEGGQRFVYKANAATRFMWVLNFVDLTATEKANLQTYFDGTAQGPTNTFTYTHTDGTARTGVRFVDTSLNWQRSGPALWAVTVTLELPAIP